MNNKKLSIILPVFNEKESLLIMVRLLNSSLKTDTEIIIVHDSLNDNSLESANILINEYENVQLVHNKIGPGVKNAIQAGVDKSKNEIILITAVDEIFPIISIEKMLEEIRNQEEIAKAAGVEIPREDDVDEPDEDDETPSVADGENRQTTLFGGEA